MMSNPTLKRLAQQVRAKVEYGARLDWDKQDEWQQKATGYTVTLYYRRGRMTVDFWMGSAHTKEPTAEDVLECLLSDASGADNARDFEDWCSEYGYDTDSRKAERAWAQVCEQTRKLRRMLGADFDAFLNAER